MSCEHSAHSFFLLKNIALSLQNRFGHYFLLLIGKKDVFCQHLLIFIAVLENPKFATESTRTALGELTIKKKTLNLVGGVA